MKQTRRYKWFVVVALLCAVLALSSCAFLEKRSSLRTAYDTYERTLTVLEGYAADGMLSDQAIERIDVAQDLAMKALEAWQEALETDVSPRRAIADYVAAVAVLIDEELDVEGGN